MAFSVEILAVHLDFGRYSLRKTHGWIGNAHTLMDDPRFRDVSHMQSYMDYAGILTVDEAVAMAKAHYHQNAQSASPEIRESTGDPNVHSEAFRNSLHGASFVLVHIGEWESGL